MEKIYFADNHAKHSADFIFHQPDGHDCWLLVLTKTSAMFQIGNQMKQYGKNHAVLFHPRQSIKYAACTEIYINGWTRFSLDFSFFEHFNIQYGVPLYMPKHAQCHQLMQLIANEHYHGNTMASVYLLKGLLSMLNNVQAKDESTIEDKLFQLHQEIQYNPGFPWTVQYMSSILNLSEGHFHRMYKKLFGNSCIDDVIKMRLSLAQNLLKMHQLKINEIAYQCGYKNTEHFCRQFHSRFGVSPNKYHDLDESAER